MEMYTRVNSKRANDTASTCICARMQACLCVRVLHACLSDDSHMTDDTGKGTLTKVNGDGFKGFWSNGNPDMQLLSNSHRTHKQR